MLKHVLRLVRLLVVVATLAGETGQPSPGDRLHVGIEQMDSGTICAAERGPNGSGIWEVYRRGDAVGYWTDVVPPVIDRDP